MVDERLEVEVVSTDPDAFQDDIHALSDALRATNQRFMQRMFVVDAAESAGGGATQLAQMSVALAPYVTAVVTGFAGWFAARAGRKVRLKIDNVEVEAGSVEEVEKLLELANARAAKSDGS